MGDGPAAHLNLEVGMDSARPEHDHSHKLDYRSTDLEGNCYCYPFTPQKIVHNFGIFVKRVKIAILQHKNSTKCHPIRIFPQLNRHMCVCVCMHTHTRNLKTQAPSLPKDDTFTDNNC